MSQARTRNISTFLGMVVCGLAAVVIAVLFPSLISINTNTTKISDMIAENHTSFSASNGYSTTPLARNPASKTELQHSLHLSWSTGKSAIKLTPCATACANANHGLSTQSYIRSSASTLKNLVIVRIGVFVGIWPRRREMRRQDIVTRCLKLIWAVWVGL